MSMQRSQAIGAIKASGRFRSGGDATLTAALMGRASTDGGLSAAHARPETPLAPHVPRGDIAVLTDIVFGGAVSILLLAIPLGFASEYLAWGPVATFTLNFLALIPLALILGDITEDLALRFGDVIGGLLNATFGNVVEVILSIAALEKGLYNVVSASLVGSILSNLLLVLGCCMLFGGVYYKTQTFNATSNRACSSLLFLSVIGIIMPTAAYNMVHDHEGREDWIVDISRLVAIIMLIIYGAYLFFQLVSHKDIFDEGVDVNGDGEICEDEQPQLSLFASLLMLTTITVLVSFSSEFLTGSIAEVSANTGLGEAFLGMIVLPIAGNACEHITAVIVAMKNKMDLALGVAMGSSLQIALFALPFCVVVGWATGHAFTLNLDPFMALVLTISVMHGSIITADAASHWLLGVQLIAVYIIIAIVYFYR